MNAGWITTVLGCRLSEGIERAHARSGILQPPARIPGSLNRKTDLPLRKQQELSQLPGPPSWSGSVGRRVEQQLLPSGGEFHAGDQTDPAGQ
jgi:hypothetical protein